MLLILFTLWYAFNAGYNVYNSKTKVMPLPIAVSTLQLLVGLVYCVPLWVLGVRKVNFSNLNVNFMNCLS